MCKSGWFYFPRADFGSCQLDVSLLVSLSVELKVFLPTDKPGLSQAHSAALLTNNTCRQLRGDVDTDERFRLGCASSGLNPELPFVWFRSLLVPEKN